MRTGRHESTVTVIKSEILVRNCRGSSRVAMFFLNFDNCTFSRLSFSGGILFACAPFEIIRELQFCCSFGPLRLSSPKGIVPLIGSWYERHRNVNISVLECPIPIKLANTLLKPRTVVSGRGTKSLNRHRQNIKSSKYKMGSEQRKVPQSGNIAVSFVRITIATWLISTYVRMYTVFSANGTRLTS